MKLFFDFKTVRSRLVVLFLIMALLPIFLLSLIIYHQRATDIRNRAFSKLTAIRDLKVERLNYWLDRHSADVSLIASDREIMVMGDLLGGVKDNKYNDYLSFSKYLLDKYVDFYQDFFEILIIDAKTGHIVTVSNGNGENIDFSRDESFFGTLKAGTVFIQDIYYSKGENRPSMSFCCPIYSLKNNKNITTVVVARVNLERSLYPLLMNRTGMGETGETLIVNKNMFALNELRGYLNAPFHLRIKAVPAKLAASGETGIIEANDYRGEPVLAAFTYIPLTQWGFVAKQDLTEIYAPIQKMLNDILILGIIFTVMMIIIAILTSHNFSRPISEMTEISHLLQAGDLTARNRIHRSDEFGILGNVFNEMADSLTSRMKTSQDIADITRVLVAAKDMPHFSESVLKQIMEFTGSSFGVFYIYDDLKNQFVHFKSIGVNQELLKPFDVSFSEGMTGQVLLTKKITYINEIPPDAVFSFRTFTGSLLPRSIVIIPLIADRKVTAIISTASLHSFSTNCMNTLELAHMPLNTVMSNIMANEKTRKLAQDLQTKNEEITLMNEELQASAEELKQRTVELKSQTRELQIQRARVEEADRLKSQFLSNMSHELRTPLNSILSLSQLMLSTGTGVNVQKENQYLEIIERNGRHLLNLINDILDLSRIEAGRTEIETTNFNPAQLVLRTVDTVKPLAHSKGLTIETQFIDCPEICSDEDKAGQILLNLFSNAVKFTHEGNIRVIVDTKPGWVLFIVEDTGIGIPESELGSIFNEFRQVDGSLTREFGGTGLGLAISRKFARLLGGEITVKSTSGKGSTFIFELPAWHPYGNCPTASFGVKTLSEPEYINHPSKLSGRPHILVVEDNDISSMQICSILKEKNFRVSTASDGAKGLEKMKNERPDAIILDLMMPHIDGFTTLEILRSSPETAEIPVLILTAKEITREELSRLKKNNIKNLIQKGSLNREQLAAAVEELFRKPVVYSASRSILVVEDNPDNLFTTTTILESAGYTAITATDGKQAVNIVREFQPGLILMDIQMPVMNGLDAIQKIKSDTQSAHIPIIALTAKAMKGDRELIMAAGCDDYISKPYDPDLLIDKIKKWIKPDQKYERT